MRLIILFVLLSLSLALMETENEQNIQQTNNTAINQEDFIGHRRRRFRRTQLKDQGDLNNINSSEDGEDVQISHYRNGFEKKNWKNSRWNNSNDTDNNYRRRHGARSRFRKDRNNYHESDKTKLNKEETLLKWALLRGRVVNKERHGSSRKGNI